jgi:hypothetical protein
VRGEGEGGQGSAAAGLLGCCSCRAWLPRNRRSRREHGHRRHFPSREVWFLRRIQRLIPCYHRCVNEELQTAFSCYGASGERSVQVLAFRREIA